MDKKTLIAEVAKNTGLTKKDATVVVAQTLEAISSALLNGENVQLLGFGTFHVKERPARSGHNPFTKETIQISSKRVISFRASKNIRDALAK